jgi:2-methylcitrate dehydratase PrpD
MDADFPTHRAAVVEIEMHGGQTYRYFARTRKGDPDDPLTDEELTAKYRELVTPMIGDRSSAHLLDTLWKLDQFDDVAKLEVSSEN